MHTDEKALQETQCRNKRDQQQAQCTKASELEHAYFTDYHQHLTFFRKFVRSKGDKTADASFPPYYIAYKTFLVKGSTEVNEITQFEAVTAAVLALRSFWRRIVEFLQHTDQLPANLFDPRTAEARSGSISYDRFEMAAIYRILVEPFEIASWYAKCKLTGVVAHYCPPTGQVDDEHHPDWCNRSRRYCFLEEKETNF